MLKGKCKNLFMGIRDYDYCLKIMKDFINLFKEFIEWNNGDAIVALINLKEYGFGGDDNIIIAYDDMCGYYHGPSILKAYEFVNIIMDNFNEYEDEEYLEDFWIPRLEKLFNKYNITLDIL